MYIDNISVFEDSWHTFVAPINANLEEEYLGHTISTDDLKLSQFKVDPLRRHQLKSFLSLIKYYLKFLLNLANSLWHHQFVHQRVAIA